jgi:hypothetical protein
MFSYGYYVLFRTEKFNNCSTILEILGYRNFNYNFYKTKVLVDCIPYILFSNKTTEYTSYMNKCLINNISQMNTNYIENHYYNIYIKNLRSLYINENIDIKNITIEQLIKYIKNHKIYKKIENDNNYFLQRAVFLSKYANDKTTERLIKVLTPEEYSFLNTEYIRILSQ